MYRVFIADDEGWIRKSIKNMIPWSQGKLEFSGESSDGQEAFDVNVENPPDILIADVRMPGLDGLQLAEKLLLVNPHLQVVIVSGYNEFEYARRAISIKAVSYLLKPIEAQELQKTLARAVQALDKVRENEDLRSRIPFLEGKLALDVLESSEGESIARFEQWVHQQGWDRASYMALVLTFDPSGYDFDGFFQIVQLLVEKWFEKTAIVLLYEGKDSLAHGIVILSSEAPKGAEFLRKLSQSMTLENLLGVTVYAGDSVGSANDLRASHRQALRVLETRKAGDESVLPPPYPLDLQKDLVASILLADEKLFLTNLDRVRHYFSETPNIPFATIRVFFHAVTSEIIKLILDGENWASPIIEQGLDFCSGLYEYHDLPSLLGWLDVYGRKALLLSSPINVGKIVDEVAKYLEQNLHEALSLNRVSSLFRVNSSYLSTMFMKRRGVGFLDYLTRLRMSKARDLLVGSDTNVGRIAAQVGYDDVRYFGKVFKKYEGCMPSEFRKRAEEPSGQA